MELKPVDANNTTRLGKVVVWSNNTGGHYAAVELEEGTSHYSKLLEASSKGESINGNWFTKFKNFFDEACRSHSAIAEEKKVSRENKYLKGAQIITVGDEAAIGGQSSDLGRKKDLKWYIRAIFEQLPSNITTIWDFTVLPPKKHTR